MIRRAYRLWSLVLISLLLGAAAPPFFAQEGGDGKREGDGPTSRPRGETFAEVTPRMKAIQELFRAPVVLWPEENRIRLMYFFNKPEPLSDFSPPWEQSGKRIRGATRGDERSSGIIISERGLLLHKGVWKNVKLDVKFSSFAGSQKQDYLAAVYSQDGGKRFVGCNMGDQLLRFRRMRITGKPLPTTFPVTRHRATMDFGLDVNDGVLTCLKKSQPAFLDENTALETSNPKWIEKDEPGQVGLMWHGRIQGYLDQFVIEGELDEAWLQAHLPEEFRDPD